MSTSSLTYRQSVTAEKRTLHAKSFTHKMAAKTSWHRYGTKFRHCHHPMCTRHQALAFRSRKRGHVTRCRQWCIANNGGKYTQTGVAKGLKVPCLFMITEVSIRCQKNPEVGIRRIPAYPPQYTTGCRSRGVGTMTSTR